ncbi:MAG: transposase [Rhodothermales bacterium]|nr:transposase [Rhodothermales bacterium]
MRELCGLDVSSSQVSRAAQELDEELQAWRAREIGQVTYLILDARYEKVRHGESCFAGLRRTPRQAILSEIDEEWATGRHYLNMEPV